jgi:two-component system OmpR family response regulator
MEVKRILIIEDEIDLCHLMKTFFVKRGFDVCMTHSIQEGLKMVKTVQPNALFLDNNLPDGNGWNYVDEILHDAPHCKITLMSAFKGKDTTIERSNVKILEKPFSMVQLSHYLNKL